MKKLFVYFLLVSTFGYSQKENILLPENNVKLDSIRNSPHYSTYITNNQELYFEDKNQKVNLVEISEMLKAEPIIENGWIERFSKEIKKNK